MKITDERLAEMVGAGVPCVPAQPGEVAAVVQELRTLRAASIPAPERSKEETGRMLAAIDELRREEGSGVEILCDNPDFNGQPNNAVICIADWTRYEPHRVSGHTLLQALENAVAHKKMAIEAGLSALGTPAPERSKEETVEALFQAVSPFIDGTAWREVRAALSVALETPPLHKEGEARKADYFAVQSVSGAHIGIWKDEKIARRIFNEEYSDGQFIPLYTSPSPEMTEYDHQALIGAAEFFEQLATGADPAPLAFAQALRRIYAAAPVPVPVTKARVTKELERMNAAGDLPVYEMADDRGLTIEEYADLFVTVFNALSVKPGEQG